MILIFALVLLYFEVEMLLGGCTESLDVPDYATVLYTVESQTKSTLPENELVFDTRFLRAESKCRDTSTCDVLSDDLAQSTKGTKPFVSKSFPVDNAGTTSPQNESLHIPETRKILDPKSKFRMAITCFSSWRLGALTPQVRRGTSTIVWTSR